MQSQDQVTTREPHEGQASRCGNGEIRDAQHDADVNRMVSAEIDERTATYHAMIATAAYFRAEKRGFQAGHELEDWVAAEAEIARRIQDEGWPGTPLNEE